MKRFLLVIISLAMFATSAGAAGQINLPTPFDMVLLAGADYQLDVSIKTNTGAAYNNVGNLYSSQFRSAPAPAGIVYANFSTQRFTNYSGGVRVSLSKAQTAKLSGKSGVWDLRQTDLSGLVSYILSGKAGVRPTVTQ